MVPHEAAVRAARAIPPGRSSDLGSPRPDPFPALAPVGFVRQSPIQRWARRGIAPRSRFSRQGRAPEGAPRLAAGAALSRGRRAPRGRRPARSSRIGRSRLTAFHRKVVRARLPGPPLALRAFAADDLPPEGRPGAAHPFFRQRLPSVSAICTALSAAPLRRLSETHQRFRPFSIVESCRMRLTKVA